MRTFHKPRLFIPQYDLYRQIRYLINHPPRVVLYNGGWSNVSDVTNYKDEVLYRIIEDDYNNTYNILLPRNLFPASTHKLSPDAIQFKYQKLLSQLKREVKLETRSLRPYRVGEVRIINSRNFTHRPR